MRLPGHPERRHLRLLPEGEQPQAAGQRHGDAEEDEEDGEPEEDIWVSRQEMLELTLPLSSRANKNTFPGVPLSHA